MSQLQTSRTWHKLALMRKFRLDKWGQLRMPEADEPTDNFVKGERWTVRPIFGILVGILVAAGWLFFIFHKR